MAKKRKRRNPTRRSATIVVPGVGSISGKGKTLAAAKKNARLLARGAGVRVAKSLDAVRRKNVEFLWTWPDGSQHPIRASSDYSYARAGEKPPKGGVGRAHARAHARRARKARGSPS